jgi:hypothetical protein
MTENLCFDQPNPKQNGGWLLWLSLTRKDLVDGTGAVRRCVFMYAGQGHASVGNRLLGVVLGRQSLPAKAGFRVRRDLCSLCSRRGVLLKALKGRDLHVQMPVGSRRLLAVEVGDRCIPEQRPRKRSNENKVPPLARAL